MAPESPRKGRTGQPNNQFRHRRSQSESPRGEVNPAHTGQNDHRDHLHPSNSRFEIDLTEEANNKLRKHGHGGESSIEAPHKRPKISSDNGVAPRTPETTSFMPTGGFLCLDAEKDRPHKDAAKYKPPELKGKHRGSKIGVHSHGDMSGGLSSPAGALQNFGEYHNDKKHSSSAFGKQRSVPHVFFQATQQELNGVRAEVKGEQQHLVSAKDENLKTLTHQFEAIRQEKDEIAQSLQEKLEAAHRELVATREEMAIYQNIAAARDAEIDEVKKQVEIANEKHKESEVVCDALRVVNKDSCRKLVEHEDEKTRTATKATKKLIEVRKDLSEVRKKLKKAQTESDRQKGDFKSQLQELKTHNDTLQADFEKQSEEWNKRMAELLRKLQESQGLSQRYNFRASDSEIVEQWGELKHKMGQFVDKYARTLPDLTGRHMNVVWDRLSPDASLFLTTPILSGYAFEAYMWEWLCIIVFNPGTLAWAGKLGQSFDALFEMADGQRGSRDELTPEIQSWRATSSNLLGRLNAQNHSGMLYRQDIEVWVADLLQLLQGNFNSDAAFHDIIDIVNDARAFQLMRRKLKAIVEVCFGGCNADGRMARFDVPVDEHLMRRRLPALPALNLDVEAKIPTVKLIVSPAVVRWGKSNGVDYDRKTCLVKMDVLYSQPEVAAQPKSAVGDQPVGTDAASVCTRQSSNIPTSSHGVVDQPVQATDSSSQDHVGTRAGLRRAAKERAVEACAKVGQAYNEDEDEDEIDLLED